MDKVLVVLSGGLDSSVATMMCVDKYGKDNVQAVTFNYNQKQVLEIDRAGDLCYSSRDRTYNSCIYQYWVQ